MNLQTLSLNCRGFTAVFTSAVALQFLLISITFPLSKLFSDTPLFYIDNVFHWYSLKLAVNLYQAGVISGYDPFFAAGVTKEIIHDPSGNISVILAILLHPFLSEIQVWKLFVFASAFIGPLAVPITLRWLSLDLRSILIGTCFGLMLWWVSLFHWYHTAGMVSFVLAAFLTFPYLVSILRLLGDQNYRFGSIIRVGLAGSALFFLHPLVSIPVILGILSYIAFNFRNISFYPFVITMTAVPIIVLIPNLVWLIPFLMHTSGMDYWQVTYQAHVSVAKIGLELLGIWGGQASGSKLYPVLVLATITPYFTRHSDDHRAQLPFIFLFAALTLYSALGGLSHTVAAFTQPNRFSPVAYLFLIPPAAAALSQLSRDVSMRLHSPVWLSRGLLGALIFGLAIVANEVRREVSYTDIGHYGARPPQVKELGNYSHTVLSWLQNYTYPDARVLFETSLGRIHDGGHMAGYYAYRSQREFIGGPYPYFHFAGYWDGYLFSRPIESLTPDDFRTYADLYNIGWVLVHSPASKRFFDNLPLASLLARFNELTLYAIQRPHSFFIQGSGRVTERAHNRLVLDQLQPVGDRVVLSYHYFPGMKTTPITTIEPFQNSNDPTPFISIKHPPKRLTLSIQK